MTRRTLLILGGILVLILTAGCLGFTNGASSADRTPTPTVTPGETPTATLTETPTATQTPTPTPDEDPPLSPDVREQGYLNFTYAFGDELLDTRESRRAPPLPHLPNITLDDSADPADTYSMTMEGTNHTYHLMYQVGTGLDALAHTIDGPGISIDRDFVTPEEAGKFPLIPTRLNLTFEDHYTGETLVLTVESETLRAYAAGDLTREEFADQLLAPLIAESKTVSPYGSQHPERYLPDNASRPELESKLLANTRTGDVVRLEPHPIEDVDGNTGVEVIVRDRNVTDDAVVSKRAGELLHELARNINKTGIENLSADRAGEEPLDFVAVTVRGESAEEWVTTHASVELLDSYYQNETSKAELAAHATTLGDGPVPARYQADEEQIVTGLTRAIYRDFAAKYGRDLEAREENMFGGKVDEDVIRVQGQAEWGDAQIMVEPMEPGIGATYAEQMILTINQTAPHLRPERGLFVYLDNPKPAHHDNDTWDDMIFLNTSGAIELTEPGTTINPWNFSYNLDSPRGYLAPGSKRADDPFYEDGGPSYWGDVPVEEDEQDAD